MGRPRARRRCEHIVANMIEPLRVVAEITIDALPHRPGQFVVRRGAEMQRELRPVEENQRRLPVALTEACQELQVRLGKAQRGGVGPGNAEVGMVESVEKLGAEPDRRLFPQREPALDREIEHVVARAGQDVAARVSECARRREPEGVCIEEPVSGALAPRQATRFSAMPLTRGTSGTCWRARPCVEYLGWRDDTRRVLAQLDLLVMPSKSEGGMPFVVLDAFAAGVPVLASPAGDLGEIIEEGVNGFLLPEPAADAIAGRLRELIEEPDRLPVVAGAAQRLWRDKFTSVRHRREIREVIQATAQKS